MTAIADRGAGNYYYLANPQSFAAIFQQEFQHAKNVAARAGKSAFPCQTVCRCCMLQATRSALAATARLSTPEICSPGKPKAVFDLAVPDLFETIYQLQGLAVRYLHQGQPYTATFSTSLQIACVNNPDEVVASIVQEEWEQKVLQEDFNALRSAWR